MLIIKQINSLFINKLINKKIIKNRGIKKTVNPKKEAWVKEVGGSILNITNNKTTTLSISRQKWITLFINLF